MQEMGCRIAIDHYEVSTRALDNTATVMKPRKDTPFLDLFQTIGLKLKKRSDESIKELGLTLNKEK